MRLSTRVRLVAGPTQTPWRSLNTRFDAPGGVHLTLFQELEPRRRLARAVVTVVSSKWRSADDGRASAFYADLLGAEPLATFDPPGLVFFDLGGVRLLLDKGAPSSLVYLRVADIEATLTRLRERGVEVVGEPHVIFTHEDATLGPPATDEWMAFVEGLGGQHRRAGRAAAPNLSWPASRGCRFPMVPFV